MRNLTSFHPRFRAMLERHGFDDAYRLHRQTKVSQTALTRYLQATGKPEAKTLSRITDAIGLAPDETIEVFTALLHERVREEVEQWATWLWLSVATDADRVAFIETTTKAGFPMLPATLPQTLDAIAQGGDAELRELRNFMAHHFVRSVLFDVAEDQLSVEPGEGLRAAMGDDRAER